MLRANSKAMSPINLDFTALGSEFSSPATTEYYQSNPGQLNKTWRTSALLQTTLDLKSMLLMFSAEVKNSVYHSGLYYRHVESKSNITIGRETKQKCSFRLLLENKQLGEITFMSGKPFTQNERSQLEFLLASLVYPLRNALQYLSVYHASMTDPLTGVNNRLILNPTLKHEIGLFHRYKTPLTLLVMDVDNFKKINDDYGHECGDRVIKVISDTLSACIRETDTLVRYGGDEFVILLSNTPSTGAHQISEYIRDTLENIELVYEGNKINFTSSFGCASLTKKDNANSLFKRADDALLHAKKCGRNRTCLS